MNLENLYYMLFNELLTTAYNAGNRAWATARAFQGLASCLCYDYGPTRTYPVADVLFKVFDAEWIQDEP